MGKLDYYLAGSGLTESQIKTAKDQIIKLHQQRWSELIKKKIGEPDIYRLKRGRIRIIYQQLPKGKFKLLRVGLKTTDFYRGY